MALSVAMEIRGRRAASALQVREVIPVETVQEACKAQKAHEAQKVRRATQVKTELYRSTCKLKTLPLQARTYKQARSGSSLKRGAAYAYVDSQCEKYGMGYCRVKDCLYQRPR
jgi:hypothetical protein